MANIDYSTAPCCIANKTRQVIRGNQQHSQRLSKHQDSDLAAGFLVMNKSYALYLGAFGV